MKIRILIITFLIALYNVYALGDQFSNYLLKPSGSYGIGYQDIFLINNNVCPDAFFHPNINEKDFSPTNKKHCHEIALRVYYPSQKTIELADEYYTPSLIGENSWIAKQKRLSKDAINNLNIILKTKTYTFANAVPISNQKFPVVVFMAGAGQSAQTYNNIISNLVSHGYIVIGVNSLFANGELQLSNDYVVKPPNSYVDADALKENISDLEFVLVSMDKMQYKFDLEKNMDFNKICLIGHSRGGMSIVNLLKQSPNYYNRIRSIILMDPGNLLLQANYPLPESIVPEMVIWSSYFKKGIKGSVSLGKNNYEVILKPKNAKDTFSNHENFSDKSTLQYNSAYQKLPNYRKILMLGYGNGYEIAQTINNYILNFFDFYIKNKVNTKLISCKKLHDDEVYIQCGV